MRRCNDQTTTRELVPVAPLQPSRGLELMQSSAKFYRNGASVTRPPIQLSYPVRNETDDLKRRQVFSSSPKKWGIRDVTMACLFLLILPGLALGAIVWCGTRMADTSSPEVLASDASSLSPRPARSIVTRGNDSSQTASNAQSDIIIHKVRTERIDIGVSEAAR